jgi:hypothetical protein
VSQSVVLPSGTLSPLLGRLGRRLRLRDGWLAAQRSLWLACAAALVIQIAGRLWPISHLVLWTLLPLALWLPAVAGFALLRPASPMRVARRVDLELGLKERLSTATAFLPSYADLARLPAYQPDLVAKQRQDALAIARSIEPRRAFPLRGLWRPLALAGALVAAVLLLALLPNPMDALVAERAEVARVAKEQAERIEELSQEIAAAELPDEEREELLRQLAELAQRLRENPGDRESALADLSKLEESLERQLDPQADVKRTALDALATQLESLAGQESGEAADPSEMDDALQELAEQVAQATEAERQALAQRLGQMAARTAQAGNTSLAQALSDLAQAAQAGDAQAASEAADAAAQAMRQAQGELSAQAALRQSLSQLGQSRQALAQAGQGQGQQAGDAQTPGQGQGGQGAQGQQGQGQSSQGGQGQGGQGTKADQLPPGTGQGEAQRPDGQARPGGVGALDPQVYVPWERRPRSGEEVTLPGQDSGQGESELRERENPLPGSPGEALVPYYEVYYEYLDAANQAMERTYVPPGLQEYVRDYFSQLEPE